MNYFIERNPLLKLKYTFILALMASCFISLQAQNKLTLDASLHSLASSNEIRPMWMVANEWGRYEQYGEFGTQAEVGAHYQLVNTESFNLVTGVRGIVNLDVSKSFLQEAFVRGNAWFLDFSIGKEQYSPIIYNDELSTGSYLMNSNARPVPRATIGIFDYLPLGFTNNWVEVKGGISQGWLNDDRVVRSNSAEDLLLHEKFAYTRLGNTKLQPYGGLVHSAIFGGTRPDGTKIPIDFLATFMAKGSSKLGGGEETNAAGAHMGMWDFGLNLETETARYHLYLQKPFADGSGMFINHGQNKDFIFGLLVKPKSIGWLSGISIELLKTDYQSGYGIFDPFYPKGYDKQGIIWFDEIDDFDQFMYDVFGEETAGWGKQDVVDYMVIHENHGYKYGGRDDYMNNGSYYNGWTYHGMNMGTALYHSAEKVRRYADSWAEVDQVFMYNNRVNGIHLGAEGKINANLGYRFKSTYSINKGTYGEEFRGRSSWGRTANYFFSESKRQVYSMVQLSWDTPWLDGLTVQGKLAFDTGQLYNSVGGMVSLTFVPVLVQ